MTTSDKLYVVRLTNGAMITCTDEAKARESYAQNPGATLGSQPFPSPVRMPRIDKADVTYTYAPNGISATYTPLGVSGHSDTQYDAYRCMLRAIRAHLEQETETVIA